jgi:hypothetical protein
VRVRDKLIDVMQRSGDKDFTIEHFYDKGARLVIGAKALHAKYA